MVLSVMMAIVLGGPGVFTVDDTLDQWEYHLLEHKWTMVDKHTGLPKLALTLRWLPGDHRVFELLMFNGPTNYPGAPWVEAWTGTYKMEARRAGDPKEDRKDAVKLVRLQVEQHWHPVDSAPYWWPERGQDPMNVGQWLYEKGRFPWYDLMYYVDWLERKEFKNFFAELIFDAPYFEQRPRQSPDNERFLLRCDAVKHLGWWQIGTMMELAPARKPYPTGPR